MYRKKIIIIASITVFLIALVAALLVNNSKNKPLTAAELLDLGEKYLLELDYEQAIVAFEKLIEIEPKNERGYTGAAEAYLGIGNTDKAIAILEQGLIQLPESLNILKMLEELLRLYSNTSDSADVNDEPAAEQEPENAGSHLSDATIEILEQAKAAFESMDIYVIKEFLDTLTVDVCELLANEEPPYTYENMWFNYIDSLFRINIATEDFKIDASRNFMEWENEGSQYQYEIRILTRDYKEIYAVWNHGFDFIAKSTVVNKAQPGEEWYYGEWRWDGERTTEYWTSDGRHFLVSEMYQDGELLSEERIDYDP